MLSVAMLTATSRWAGCQQCWSGCDAEAGWVEGAGACSRTGNCSACPRQAAPRLHLDAEDKVAGVADLEHLRPMVGRLQRDKPHYPPPPPPAPDALGMAGDGPIQGHPWGVPGMGHPPAISQASQTHPVPGRLFLNPRPPPQFPDAPGNACPAHTCCASPGSCGTTSLYPNSVLPPWCLEIT